MTDFLIVGAGINGMLLARELSAAGASVRLLEQGQPGREASWAGGGIVSPLYPWRYGPAITALASWAQNFYPRLASALLEETGVDAEFEACGLLMLDAQDEQEALDWARGFGRDMNPIGVDACYAMEAGLAPGFRRGLWMPQVANVRNPRLCAALSSSLQQNPRVEILAATRLEALRCSQGRVNELQVKGPDGAQSLRAGCIILSTGAWSGELASRIGLRLPVFPVKGQMLLYKFDLAPVQRIVLSAGRYLIPRRDGHLLVGSTLEHCGFDKEVTDEARHSLEESAAAMLPLLAETRPRQQWAGLRPSTGDGLPYIGRVPGFENLYINAGQFRNGLVLAPASARLLADLLLQRQPIVDPRPYRPVPERLSSGGEVAWSGAELGAGKA